MVATLSELWRSVQRCLDLLAPGMAKKSWAMQESLAHGPARPAMSNDDCTIPVGNML